MLDETQHCCGNSISSMLTKTRYWSGVNGNLIRVHYCNGRKLNIVQGVSSRHVIQTQTAVLRSMSGRSVLLQISQKLQLSDRINSIRFCIF
ncbi:hypothetical protein ANCCAN_09246 [Ancylostoma caninum]|uniref:Uncharacterized protein n=1 Tax=Ancylostoma caninum TaxID=29170 RepID=A0A368GK15_ANCCA|nr:hypothetical protein ANCCAN_09246 [Ancylostoma caninum]